MSCDQLAPLEAKKSKWAFLEQDRSSSKSLFQRLSLFQTFSMGSFLEGHVKQTPWICATFPLVCQGTSPFKDVLGSEIQSVSGRAAAQTPHELSTHLHMRHAAKRASRAGIEVGFIPSPRHPSCPPLVITPPATTARPPPECVSPGESERAGFACLPGVPTSHACHIWPGDIQTTTHACLHAPYVPRRCV